MINADVLSRKASPKDRNIYPLIGDAAAITVVERDADNSVIYANLKMDGTRERDVDDSRRGTAPALLARDGGSLATWATTIFGPKTICLWMARRCLILFKRKFRE